jgi:hypothetical protein
MKITIQASCLGKDGEHLEQGTTVDYPEAAALNLIRLGRAASTDGSAPDAGGDESTSEADALLKLTKAELLELAAAEEVEIKASANKEQIAEAILLKRSAAA